MRLVDYTTSAETTGDFDEVVGYLSAVMVAGKEAKARKPEIGQPVSTAPEQDSPIDPQGQEFLHSVVYDAISAALQEKEYVAPTNKQLERIEKGAFVHLVCSIQ